MLYHPFQNETSDPVVIESMQRAAKLTIAFTRSGHDAFEFKGDAGTHYVVHRNTAMRCMEFDRLIAYTSVDMIRALDKIWSHPGRC